MEWMTITNDELKFKKKMSMLIVCHELTHARPTINNDYDDYDDHQTPLANDNDGDESFKKKIKTVSESKVKATTTTTTTKNGHQTR